MCLFLSPVSRAPCSWSPSVTFLSHRILAHRTVSVNNERWPSIFCKPYSALFFWPRWDIQRKTVIRIACTCIGMELLQAIPNGAIPFQQMNWDLKTCAISSCLSRAGPRALWRPPFESCPRSSHPPHGRTGPTFRSRDLAANRRAVR